MSKNNIDSLIVFLKEEMNNKESQFYKDKKNFMNLLDTNFKDISNDLSAIINVIDQDSFNTEGLQRLEYMVKMSKKVKDNNMSEHDASVAVGQRLVDDIVKPQLD